MRCCCFLYAGGGGVVFVGCVCDDSYGFDAGVDVGFEDGACSCGYVVWFHNRFAHALESNRPDVATSTDTPCRFQVCQCRRSGAIPAVPIWSKLYIYPG